MSRRSVERAKGRRTRGPFIALPRALLDSPQWASLNAFEVKLLLDVAVGYRGNNNGDLACTWNAMKRRGWRSKATLESALKGLLAAGFLVKTRQGWRNRCSLYAVTWEPINECGGKHDAKPSPVPLNTWTEHEKKLALPHGAMCPTTRVNGASNSGALPRLVG